MDCACIGLKPWRRDKDKHRFSKNIKVEWKSEELTGRELIHLAAGPQRVLERGGTWKSAKPMGSGIPNSAGALEVGENPVTHNWMELLVADVPTKWTC